MHITLASIYSCSNHNSHTNDINFYANTISDGHDKPFCANAITIIDNFKNALGDTDKSQFFKAISVIDKLSPINFSDKCCGKLSMCLTKFFFLASQFTKVFF